jgi:O-succinylbenzoic acid--CoA ligase
LNVLAARFSNHPAVMDREDRVLTYRQLNQYAHALAAHLIALGLQPGQAIATLLPNSIEAVWVSYGIRLAGGAETPLSSGYTLDEIMWCAALAKFDYVLTDGSRDPALQSLGLETISIAAIPIHHGADHAVPAMPAIEADQQGRILFTSGTTGKPKGVPYTHGARWVGEQLLKATLPFTPQAGARLLLMTPFVHGASLLTYAWCDFGGTVVLHPGVDMTVITPLLQAGNLEAIFAPPTVLAKITAALEGQVFQGVRCIFTGTQPLTRALYLKASHMFGPKVRITYGKSECVNPITVLTPADTQHYFATEHPPSGACVGWPAPGVEIQILARAASDTHALEQEEQATEEGEIYLRAAHMSSGLIDASGFHPHEPDGWHQTGDLGYLDAQGRLMLTGRTADVIKTGGYRVNPDEIEAALVSNPLCSTICITSISSDYWGEIIIAVAQDTQPGWASRCEMLLEGMSRHKKPRQYLSVDTLPRNPQGKISRRQVAKLILDTHQLTDGPYPELVYNHPVDSL